MHDLFSSRSLAIAGLVLTSLFWSGNILVSKLLVGIVPPFTLNLYRWIIAFTIIVPFAIPKLRLALPFIKQSWLKLCIYSFLSVTVYNSFLYNAAYTTEGINIAVISTITPLLTFITAWVFFGDKPSRFQLIGFVFGISGVLLLISKGDLSLLGQLNFSKGDIWMMSASFSWAVYTAYLVKKPQGIPPLVFLLVTITLGILLALPFVAWEMFQRKVNVEFDQTVILSLIYVSVFPSVGSYLLFNNGVRVLGSQIASLCMYLIPVFTAVIGILFLQEAIHWFHIVSQLLVFIGFYLALMKQRV